MKKLFTLSLLVLVLFAAVMPSLNVQADSIGGKRDSYSNPFYIVCFDPLFTGGAVLVLECGLPSNSAKDSSHDTSESNVTIETETEDSSIAENEDSSIAETESQDDSSDKTPVITETHKVNCNNGNGNGSEGCNSSDKGNQDETSVKGDKDVNHPTK